MDYKKLGQLAHKFRLTPMLQNSQYIVLKNDEQHNLLVYELACDIGAGGINRNDVVEYINGLNKNQPKRVEGNILPYIAYADFVMSLTENGFNYLFHNYYELIDEQISRGDVDKFIQAIVSSYRNKTQGCCN